MTKSKGIRKHYAEPDLIGRQFGKLTVLKEANEGDGHNRRMMECQCSCGNKHTVVLSNLLAGRTKSCGCSRPKFKRTRKCPPKGTKFGRLTVVGEHDKVGRPKRRAVTVTCSCNPDEETWVYFDNLINNQVRSCGCLKQEYYDSLRGSAVITTPEGVSIENVAASRLANMDETTELIDHKDMFAEED